MIARTRSINEGVVCSSFPTIPSAMASLSSLPTDVLEQIALLCSSPLTNLLHLMLTCRSIYHKLAITQNAFVYANVCRELFDVPFISQGIPPNSAVAAELVQRLRLFRRIRRGDLTVDSLHQDLWTAFGLVLEGGQLNASLLVAAGLHGFLEKLLQRSTGRWENRIGSERWEDCRNVATWLFALTITREDVIQKPEEAREELLRILRPLVVNQSFDINEGSLHSFQHVFTQTTAAERLDPEIVFYSKRQRPQCPPVVSAVVTLCFALRQTHTLQLPPNLPANRAAAIASQRSGPTRDDYNSVVAFRTPLFADIQRSSDSRTAPDALNSSRCSDPCLRRLFIHNSELPSVYEYIQRTLPGVWDGAYLISPSIQYPGSTPSPDMHDADFVSQKPMQCALDVRFSFSPTLPEHMDANPLDWDTDRRPFQGPDAKNCDRRLDAHDATGRDAWRHPDQALDCIITGQTLADHDEAWGAFRFYGRVQRDGKIILKRVPKYTEGTTIFEGYLCYGASWVGTWHDGAGCRGIFSMRKREDPEEEK